MKRFYEVAAAVAQDPAEAGEPVGRYRVELDGRPIKTPGKALLLLPTRDLAYAVAGEWTSQGATVEPHRMPLMALACTAIDLVPAQRGETISELVGHGETDLLCYRAEDPPELVRRQAASWQPLLDWAALSLDAPLNVTTGILHRLQPTATLDALRRAVERHGDMELTALATAVQAAGSLVIGLALSHGRVSALEAFSAAELDASYQMELWGEDAEALQRRDSIRAELEAAQQFLALLRA